MMNSEQGTTAINTYWEHFSHQADMGIRGVGETKAQAFEQAAKALTAVITDLSGIHPLDTVIVKCEAPDDELLLVDWLNAIIYQMAARRALFSEFHVQLEDGGLIGELRGEPVDVTRHQPAVEIKAATYTSLSVNQEGDGHWVAQCVVDV